MKIVSSREVVQGLNFKSFELHVFERYRVWRNQDPQRPEFIWVVHHRGNASPYPET
jgi:hypothetical protein